MITWKPIIDGDDLVIGTFTEPVTASWFGGPHDSMDDGQSASGTDNTKMGVLGCSLPMYKNANGALVSECSDSPLGPIPWHTRVLVNALIRGRAGVPVVGVQQMLSLIDVGPATRLNRPIDICPTPFLNLGGNIDVGLLHVFFRVFGAAKYLRATP